MSVEAAGGASTPETVVALARTAPRRWVRWRLLQDRTALVGLAIVATFAVAAVLAPMLAPHDPNEVDVLRKFRSPSAEFPLGTDNLGRDVLSRLLYGARLSIGTAVVAAVGISLLGLTLGMLAGYFGGIVDAAISRVVDGVLAVPTFLLALAVTGTLGPNLRNVTIAVVVVWWAGYARIVRAAILAERGKAYVEAARQLGAGDRRILLRHLLPNIVAPVVVLTTLDMGAIMLGVSALSFLGLGVRPPTPEWGSMLAEARNYLGRAPYMMVFPGVGHLPHGDGLQPVRRRPARRTRPTPARDPRLAYSHEFRFGTMHPESSPQVRRSHPKSKLLDLR